MLYVKVNRKINYNFKTISFTIPRISQTSLRKNTSQLRIYVPTFGAVPYVHLRCILHPRRDVFSTPLSHYVRDVPNGREK